MGTYLQWNRTRPVRRVTWVCGPEAVLARDVVAEHQAGAVPDQQVTLFAGNGPEREVWDMLESSPPGGGRRAVVHGAEKLKNLSGVAGLAADGALAASFVVFVSAAGDFERADGALAPHLAALQASRSGQLVRCCAPSKPEDRTALVAAWWPGLPPYLAREVLARCGSLERAWHACAQARAAGLSPEAASLPAVCQGEPAGDLADLIMAGRRKAAMAVAGEAAAGAVIGLLAARLAVAEQVADGVRSGLPVREAVARHRQDRFLANRVAPYAAAYDPGRVRRCRRLLAGLDAAWRSGARDGVAESLIALW
jgi:hypothetical protein